jgi:hypothetical protein
MTAKLNHHTFVKASLFCICTLASTLTVMSVSLSSEAAPTFEWKMLVGYDLARLLNDRDVAGRSIENMSTAGLAWPDGRQAIVTTFQIIYESDGKKKAFLYRCVDNYTADMQWNGQGCYEARTPRPKAAERK